MTNEDLKRYIKKTSKLNGNCVEAFTEAVGGEDALVQMLSEHPIEQVAYQFKSMERFLESEYGGNMLEAGGVSATATAVFSLLGVSAAVYNAYETPKNFVKDVACYNEPSKTFQEPKAFLFQPDLPDVLDDMQEPSESGFYPRSLVVTNQDFGKAWKISRRAIDDDQVGQFARIPSQIGELHKNLEEIYFAAYLYGQNFSTNGRSVSVPTYRDPDGTLGVYVQSGDRQNAIADAALSLSSLQDLLTISKAIKDPGGKTMLISPSLLITGTAISPTAAVILNSQYYPAVISGATGATATGTINSINPLDPKYGAFRAALDLREEPYFNGTLDLAGATASSKNWWGVQEPKKNGIVWQTRQALEVMMESPNAGDSIRTRSIYNRTYQRYAPYHGDARFLFRGNSGTV